MKNGLLTYSDKYPFYNIGDYIQSLAAKQYFAQIDHHLCREDLHSYFDEDMKIILNGWFMHKPENWPPSDSVHPLFVSFHINSVARDSLTSPDSIAYLKKHSPIGCRDHDTADLLKQHGVDAYFTGCLTLTLGRSYKRELDSGKIFFVDPHFKNPTDARSLLKYLRVLASNTTIISVIAEKMFGNTTPKHLLKASAFYLSYSKMFADEVLMQATYISQVMLNSAIEGDEAKFDLADNLLQQYAAAKFVVTSRIHCALPCLGIGTPVLYVDDEQQAETSYCRLKGLKELFHVIRCSGSELKSDVTSGKINADFKFENKTNYQPLAEKLIHTCTSFAERS